MGIKYPHIVAIIIGVIILAVSFIPIFLTMNHGYKLAHPKVVGVFLFPTIGVSVAGLIVFLSFMMKKK